MRTKIIKFVKEFTDCPGGRLMVHGEFSGEAFREKFLKPAILEFDLVELHLDGAFGFPSSFIDEAFGILVDELGYELLKKKLKIFLTDDDLAFKEIFSCMEAHNA